MSYSGMGIWPFTDYDALRTRAIAQQTATRAAETSPLGPLVTGVAQTTVGAVVGGIVGVGLAGAGFVWWLRRSRRKRSS